MSTFDKKRENLPLELKTLEETKALAMHSIEGLQLSKVEQNIEQKTEELRQVKQKVDVSSKLLK